MQEKTVSNNKNISNTRCCPNKKRANRINNMKLEQQQLRTHKKSNDNAEICEKFTSVM